MDLHELPTHLFVESDKRVIISGASRAIWLEDRAAVSSSLNRSTKSRYSETLAKSVSFDQFPTAT
jgi:hypothetical protein